MFAVSFAGKKAEKTASLNDAIEYATKRVACLERLPVTTDVQKKIIDVRTTLGLYYLQTDFFVKAKDAVEPIVEMALERNYRRRIAQIHIILGTYMMGVENDIYDLLLIIVLV